MMTPPFNIFARPALAVKVESVAEEPLADVWVAIVVRVIDLLVAVEIE